MYLNKLKKLQLHQLLLPLSAVLLLAGCMGSGDAPKVLPMPEAPPIIAPDKPRAITTKPINFVVITQNNLDKLQSEPVWYAITPDSYENLAFNTQEMLRFIKQQKTIIEYYESATAPK